MNRRQYIGSASALLTGAITGCTENRANTEADTPATTSDSEKGNAKNETVTTQKIDYEFPDTVSKDGISDVEKLGSQHYDTAKGLQFKFDRHFLYDTEPTYEVEVTGYNDPAGFMFSRYSGTAEGTEVEGAVYWNDGDFYVKRKEGDNEPTYDHEDSQSFQGRTPLDSVSESTDILRNFTHEFMEFDKYDGHDVALFEVGGIADGASTIVEGDGTTYVSEHPLIVNYDYSGLREIESEEVDFEASAGMSEIGEAEVKKPDWLDKARS